MSDDVIRCLDPMCPDYGDPDFGEATCPSAHADPELYPQVCPTCERVDPEGGLRQYTDVDGRRRKSCVDQHACAGAYSLLPAVQHRAEQARARRRMMRRVGAIRPARPFGTWSK